MSSVHHYRDSRNPELRTSGCLLYTTTGIRGIRRKILIITTVMPEVRTIVLCPRELVRRSVRLSETGSPQSVLAEFKMNSDNSCVLHHIIVV